MLPIVNRLLLLKLYQNLLFLFGPAMHRDFIALQAQPFEEAGLAGSPRNQRRDKVPALDVVLQVRKADVLPLTMPANQPNQDFQVADAPVSLELVSFYHSMFTKQLLFNSFLSFVYHCLGIYIPKHELLDLELLNKLGAYRAIPMFSKQSDKLPEPVQVPLKFIEKPPFFDLNFLVHIIPGLYFPFTLDRVDI